MRSRRSNAYSVHDILDGISQERLEQYQAQIAAFSCSVSLNAIRKGIQVYIINTRKKPKTKYEYNKERVRDFRVGKGEIVPATINEVADDLETYGRASYSLLQTDPVPFVRNYDYAVFNQTLRLLNPLHPHASSIEKLDLSNQLIGHDRFVELCDVIGKSSLKYINLTGNKLTSESMRFLSTIIRSLHQLEDLNISRNRITDEGIGHILSDNTYPSTLKTFNCSYNALNAATAFHIGHMFKAERNTALVNLVVGGKVGIKGWGDEFMRVLACCVVDHGLCKLKSLVIADAGLSEAGLDCVSLILSCDLVALEYLNISKNEFSTHISRTHFINALRLNKSLREVFIREDGFSEIQSSHIISIVRSNYRDSALNKALAAHSSSHRQHLKGEYRLSWPERVSLSTCIGRAYSACKHSYHRTKISFMKDTPWKMAGPPVWQIARHVGFDSNLITNIATLFSETQVILPVSIRNMLEHTNEDLKYADLLRESLQVSKTMAVDPRKLQIAGSTQDNRAVIDITVQETEDLVEKMDIALTTYEEMSNTARQGLFAEVEQFRADSEAVLRVAKRKERKNIQVIINEVSTRMNVDRLQLCVEDFCAAVSEESQALEQSVGALHRQKMLHFCLTQEYASRTTKKFDFISSLRSTLPYYGNLGIAATFTHYFYLIFPVERKDNKILESMALMKIGRTWPLLALRRMGRVERRVKKTAVRLINGKHPVSAENLPEL